MKSKRLIFKSKEQASPALFDKFMPGGSYVLNKSEWRGFEPRSCAITGLRSSSTEGPHAYIEITHRPKGYISYTGGTRYDGWTAMVPAEPNKPLKDGEKPEYVAKEVFPDVEFNDIDFGEFVEETDVGGIKRTTHEAVLATVKESGSFSGSVKGSFMAPHRSRPLTKIILSNAQTGEIRDGFGTRILNISMSTPNLEQVLMQQLTELMHDFIQGKASIKNLSGGGLTFVELSDSLVDCEPNEQGFDSWFDVLNMYTPVGFLEDLAKQLVAVYEIEIEVVEGKNAGLVLRRETSER